MTSRKRVQYADTKEVDQGADKSIARPIKKQATTTKLLQATQKK